MRALAAEGAPRQLCSGSAQVTQASRLRSTPSPALPIEADMDLALRPPHGSIRRRGPWAQVYCTRCDRWQVVEVAPELALSVHELVDHSLTPAED